MKEMIWASECAQTRRPRYSAAPMTISLTKNESRRSVSIKLNADTYTKASITPTDGLDVGFDPGTCRIAIRVADSGPCHLTGKSKSGMRYVSLLTRPEWRLKPELTIANAICAIEVIRTGYIQARLPHSWNGAFV